MSTEDPEGREEQRLFRLWLHEESMAALRAWERWRKDHPQVGVEDVETGDYL